VPPGAAHFVQRTICFEPREFFRKPRNAFKGHLKFVEELVSQPALLIVIAASASSNSAASCINCFTEPTCPPDVQPVAT